MTRQEKNALDFIENCKKIDKNVDVEKYEQNGVITIITRFTEKYRYARCGDLKHDRNGTCVVYGDGHMDFY